ncbi:MAG: N-acetylmuramoyl-L-alanine amidase [Treponema sp.]|nr:N-acetylmuramoyl-L-alanine amidase [Treponema sp.]MCL2252711.1 N-acetylmuramoyl-L-alanine amidase [Treponema sp.]
MKRFIKHKYFVLFYIFFFISSVLFSLTLDETISAIQAISPNKPTQFRWNPLFRNGVFTFGNHYGSFNVGNQEGESGYLLINNEIFNVPIPYNNGDTGVIVFPDEFVSAIKNTFTRLHEAEASRFRISTIIIDPGHGGRDSGAVGYLPENGRNKPVYEKDIVLNVALALRNRLSQTYRDKQILMTRDTDIFKTLDYRADMANAITVNENEAVIFISIHANWGSSPNARGYEVWHITTGHRRDLLADSRQNYSSDISAILNAMLEEEYTKESILLADEILNGFKQTFGDSFPSRGRKANDWFVVRNSRMPAVLVELGFVSNRQDAILMTDENGLQRLTSSLYNGIVNFIGIVER